MRRQTALFAFAVAVPCLLVLGMAFRMVDQERRLAVQDAEEDHRRKLDRLRSDLLLKLEKPREFVLSVPVRGGKVVLPWEDATRDRQFQAGANRLRDGEREEITRSNPERAIQSYRQVLATANNPVEGGYARLLLARALEKSGQKEQATGQLRLLVRGDLNIADDAGIPLAFYAGVRLGPAERMEVIDRARGRAWLSPEAWSLACEMRSQDWLRDKRRDAEQAVRLQAEYPRIALGQWLLFGNSNWLVKATESNLVAVDAHRLVASAGARLAAAGQGEPLGDGLSSLRVTLPAPAAVSSLRGKFPGAVIALLLSLTAFAGYLLWRDVRREIRMARLRSEFVSSVSHELKTPLTSVRMFAETMMLDPELEDSTRREYLETILHESERLSRLVDNILEFAKIEQGRKTYEMRPVQLADVVESAARAVEFPMRQLGFRLEILKDPVPPALGDRDALEQAVLNLLSNAVKYSGEARDIALTLCRENGRAVIRVRDRGIGIARDEQTRIYERFYRAPVHGETKRIPGAGLGLTLVAHAAGAHGGEVTLDSQPGQGSTFSIHIPLQQEAV